MSTTYQTCKHLHDSGYHCKSAVAKDRDYCLYHLRHRARQLQAAQARARNQRLAFHLPPLEDMYAVQSALTQIAEASAAGMIDLPQARFLLSTVRAAGQFLLQFAKWPASPYHSEQPAPAVDLAAEYGLPADISVDTLPEVAFPPPQNSAGVILSEAGGSGAPPLSPGAPPLSPAFGDRVGNTRPPSLSSPWAEADPLECHPQDIELQELLEAQGLQAMESRAREHQYNDRRRNLRKLYRANYDRYVAEAKARNIRRAADKLLQQQQAPEQTPASAPSAPDALPSTDSKKPPAPAGTSVSQSQSAKNKA